MPGTSTGGETLHGNELRRLNQQTQNVCEVAHSLAETVNAANLNESSSTASEDADSSNSSIASLLTRRKRLATDKEKQNEQGNRMDATSPPPAKIPRSGVRFNWPAYPEHTFATFEECDAFIKSNICL